MKKIIPVIVVLLMSCTPDLQQHEVIAVGAMKNVMWKGELEGIVNLDAISPKEGLYGLGPLAGLRGEIMINDGKVFVSTIDDKQNCIVEENSEASAPFFVYAHNTNWNENALPKEVRSVKAIEDYLISIKGNYDEPFVFKLIGEITSAKIHIQNLPEGTRVTNPKEAHQGQVDFDLGPQAVEIIGFFSTRHQRVFTHHDSFIHMHLLTDDEKYMGHLDDVVVKEMILFVPKSVLNN